MAIFLLQQLSCGSLFQKFVTRAVFSLTFFIDTIFLKIFSEEILKDYAIFNLNIKTIN